MKFVAIVCLGFCMSLRAAVASQAGSPGPALVPALGWDVKQQGGFPVSLAAGPAGDVWVGTEGNGVWRYDPGAKSWRQFTTKDGLGDDCVYALAFDQQHRLWAGHLNHGVSVFNGEKWRNYGFLDGPLGDRVFSIAVCPKDGAVWIATDLGLARYSEAGQTWDYYTRAARLPSDQIQSITFDNNGQVYAGTQAHGIAIASPADNYAKWRVVTTSGSTPDTADGEGMVTDMINGLCTLPLDGVSTAIAAYTPLGGVISTDGSDWKFVRGMDWKDHAAGADAAGGSQGEPRPAEDWITAASSAASGRIWVGYRKAGVEEIPLSGQPAEEAPVKVANGTAMIRAILPMDGQAPLVAAYDGTAGGLFTLPGAKAFGASPLATGTGPLPPLPAPVKTPTLEEGKALGVRLGKLTAQMQPGEGYFLADDWRTEGDWIGRYGSGYVKLCGMAQGGDQDYSLIPGFSVHLQLGPHHVASAAGPVWYHDNLTSDDLRSLYDPTLGHRRDAEENDVSYDTKTYPETYDGPGLWVRLKVPEGVNCLSLYFLNNDAHAGGPNKYRDYDVALLNDNGAGDEALAAQTPLARTRVTDFWGGVYKQFLVCGPADFVVRIGRNRSFVTKLQGVFLDPVTGAPPIAQLPGFDNSPYGPPKAPADYHPNPLADAAINLWGELDDALSLRGAIPLQMPLRVWCYRAATAAQAPPSILEVWRWQISVWTPEDRKNFDAAVKAAHDAAQ